VAVLSNRWESHWPRVTTAPWMHALFLFEASSQRSYSSSLADAARLGTTCGPARLCRTGCLLWCSVHVLRQSLSCWHVSCWGTSIDSATCVTCGLCHGPLQVQQSRTHSVEGYHPSDSEAKESLCLCLCLCLCLSKTPSWRQQVSLPLQPPELPAMGLHARVAPQLVRLPWQLARGGS
jgi:hypothetical protein